MDKDNRPIAEATYDEQERRWVWKKVEEKLQLVPAELTLDEAKRFIAGAEHWSEEELKQRFEGRVFRDEKTGAMIVLSREASNHIRPKNQDELIKQIASSRWGRILGQITINPSNNFLTVFSFDANQTPVVLLVRPDSQAEANSRRKSSTVTEDMKTRGFVFYSDEDEEEQLKNREISTYCSSKRFYITPTIFQWDDERNKLIAHDGLHVQYIFIINSQGQYDWQPVPPGQHEYLIKDPQKQVEFIVNSHSARYGTGRPRFLGASCPCQV